MSAKQRKEWQAQVANYAAEVTAKAQDATWDVDDMDEDAVDRWETAVDEALEAAEVPRNMRGAVRTRVNMNAMRRAGVI